MKNSHQINWPMQLRQLAVMMDSGIPIAAALKSINTKTDQKNVKLQKAQRWANRGMSLPEAFRRADLVNDFDYTMLHAADTAGRISDGLNHISERRLNQLQRAERFKSSLILPKAVVLIGGIAGVFVKISVAQQSLSEALVSVGVAMTWFYLVVYASVLLVKADTRVWMSWLWPYPVVRKNNEWYRTALEYLFYNSLVWQIAGGIDASSATKGCSQLLKSQQFQSSVMAASDSMAKGLSMTQALTNEGLVLTDRLRQVILIADQSGTHEAAIKHEMSLQRMILKQKAVKFFKLAPRVFYVMALVVTSEFFFV